MRGAIVRLFLAFLAAISVALVLRPTLRAALMAEFHDPARLPALPTDSRIHYEADAQICASRLAGLLPAAMARIESIHGVPLAKAPVIGLYDSFDNYARANGLGDAGIAGVSRAGRILLSPTLCGEERERLDSVLTHELSHAHFFGRHRRGSPAPPAWFTEGLAVMASDGGGAEGLSEAEAAAAIRAGIRVILDDGAWTDFSAIRFTREPTPPVGRDLRAHRQRLAFRQAGLFVSWLRELKPEAFRQLLRDLEQGADFQQAFSGSFGQQWENYWERFIKH